MSYNILRTPHILLLGILLCISCGHPDTEEIQLSHFATRQQTTDYTCGCVSAMMVMDYYGHDHESETDLAVKMHTHVDSDIPDAQPGSAHRLTDYGTSVVEIYNYFQNHPDYRIVASNYTPEGDLALLADSLLVGVQAVGNVPGTFSDYGEAATFFRQQLQQGHPIMVCWNAWGGHWTVCIGYDDHGTPDFYDDDILTMADPYDSTDGTMDGLTHVGLVHFFYDWFCTMTPKPWQLQPYIVVAPQHEVPAA